MASTVAPPLSLPAVPPGAPVARIIGAVREFVDVQQLDEADAALIWQQIQPILWQMVTLELQTRGAGQFSVLTGTELDALIQEEVAAVRQARYNDQPSNARG